MKDNDSVPGILIETMEEEERTRGKGGGCGPGCLVLAGILLLLSFLGRLL